MRTHCLPTFLCIGAQRAGTTWLHNLLASHPRVYVPTRRKEIHYYDWYYHRGLNWYRSFFPHQNQAQKYAALGEVTPDYLYESEAPKRIAETNPEIKLIVMLRNPIDRAFSHYRLLVRDYNCTTSFRDIIRENGDVVQRGFYSRYLKPFRQVFGPGRILPLIFEKALEDRIPFLRVITSNPGKANACNALVTESKYDLLLFVDADIVLFRHALSTAYRCLFSDPELILVSTATARVNESMELGYSFIIRPFVIHGRFYLVKKNKLLERMRLIAGTAQIPSYIINEDAWVGMVATKGEPKYRFNRVIQEPLALYRGPEGLRDKFRTIVRVRRGRSQIRYFFGAAPEKNSIGTLVKICLGRQRSGRGMLKAIAQFFFCTIRAFALATTYKIMDLYNAIFYPVRRSIARGRAAVWNSVKSTKLPIEIKGGREG